MDAEEEEEEDLTANEGTARIENGESEEKESKEDDRPPDTPKKSKKETEEEAIRRREKYKDWPMKNIEEPHNNDVLYGRGGGTNHHPGNKRYRKLVEDRKIDYVNSKRLDKPLVALEIIREWRSQEPPGRFLKLDEKTKKWNDVGDKKAREKTSQALREKAPMIRKKQEEERIAQERKEQGLDSGDEDAEERSKSTRFAEGTNLNDGGREDGISKAVLARDHSLGREYLEPNQAMTLDGFSWQDPFRSGNATNSPQGAGRVSSQGNYSPPGGFHPEARMGSHGSMGGPGYRFPSQGSVGPPVLPGPPGTYTHVRSGEERHFRYTVSGRYESWGSEMPPPMPGYGYPQASGSSWSARDNSLGQNPLPHASVGHPAPYSTFDPHARAPSGQWGPPPPPNGYPPYNYSGGAPPYPREFSGPREYSGPRREYAGPPPREYGGPREYSGGHPMPSPTNAPTSSSSSRSPSSSPRFEVDPKVASTWSGQSRGDIARTWSAGSGGSNPNPLHDARHRKSSSVPATAKTNDLPKPDFVKRATSHQNENPETKPDLKGPSVKRAALNRDNSSAANRLKEQYMPDYFQMKKFNDELLKLSDEFEQTVGDGVNAPLKPKPLSQEERVSTIDQIAMDLMVKPGPLVASNRSSTIDALALEFDDDPLIRPEGLSSRASTMDGLLPELSKDDIDRPPALGPDDRLTTSDVLALVAEPIPDDEMELISGNRQNV